MSVEPALAELLGEVRRRRRAAGLSHAQLAMRAGYARQYISDVERPGKGGVPSLDLIRAIDGALDAGGALLALRERALAGKLRRRRDIADRSQATASQRTTGQSGDVDDDEAGQADTRRAALHALGGVAMRALTGDFGTALGDVKPVEHFQLARSTLVDNDNMFGPRFVVPVVEQHIVSIGACCDVSRGADRRGMLRLRARFAEFNGWLYQDLGNHAAAQYWLDRALDWAFCDPADLPAYVLARKSQLAVDMGDTATAVGMGELAIAAATTPRMKAIASTFTAHSYALKGQARESEHLYDSARELVQRADAGPDAGLGSWLDVSYIEVYRAGSLDALGRHAEAAATFAAGLRGLGPGFHRDKGVYLARAANAHAGAGDLERAVEMGIAALGVVAEAHSGRTLIELRRLAGRVSGTASPTAAEFRAHLRRVCATAPTPRIEETPSP